MQRQSIDEYFLTLARHAASRCTCPRVPEGVGCVLVNPERKIVLSTGYGGSPRGEPHCTDAGCLIDPVTGGCIRTLHAEINAIIQGAENGTSLRGATVYTTLSPCWACWLAIVNLGSTRVVYAKQYRVFERQMEMATRRGIELVHLPLAESDRLPHQPAGSVVG